MKRIIMLLTVAALLVVALTATAGSGFAAERCRGDIIKPQFECERGGGPPRVVNPGGNEPGGQQPSPGQSGK
jgi:hypothetical protein